MSHDVKPGVSIELRMQMVLIAYGAIVGALIVGIVWALS
jgi:hypothetical protein